MRGRARALALGGLVVGPVLACFAPLSFRVVAPGVLQPSTAVVLHAGADGFVSGIVATEGQVVRAGQLVASLGNDILALEVVRAEARFKVGGHLTGRILGDRRG